MTTIRDFNGTSHQIQPRSPSSNSWRRAKRETAKLSGFANWPERATDRAATRISPDRCGLDPLSEIVGTMAELRAHATEYDNLADFLHDETVACDRCGTRWYRPALAQFDADILARNGLVVCCECAAAGSAALRGAGPEAARREFVTRWARNGGVVG